MTMCNYCGADNVDGAEICAECGKSLKGETKQATRSSSPQNNEPFVPVTIPRTTSGNISTANQSYSHQEVYSNKSRVTAGILGLLWGSIGIGRFYLGYTGLGVAQLLVTIFTAGIGAIWGFIDGIIILCGGVKTDGNGYTLK